MSSFTWLPIPRRSRATSWGSLGACRSVALYGGQPHQVVGSSYPPPVFQGLVVWAGIRCANTGKSAHSGASPKTFTPERATAAGTGTNPCNTAQIPAEIPGCRSLRPETGRNDRPTPAKPVGCTKNRRPGQVDSTQPGHTPAAAQGRQPSRRNRCATVPPKPPVYNRPAATAGVQPSPVPRCGLGVARSAWWSQPDW